MIGTSKHKDQIQIFFQKNGQVISHCLEIVNGFNCFFAGIGPKLAAEIGPSDITCQVLGTVRFSRRSMVHLYSSPRTKYPKPYLCIIRKECESCQE